jgi:hypothetical protein
VFTDAGFSGGRGLFDVPRHEPRHPAARERCASTSNRNFEGRQGRGRTHLVSPQMAAAAAIVGHFVDIRSGVRQRDSNTEAQRMQSFLVEFLCVLCVSVLKRGWSSCRSSRL